MIDCLNVGDVVFLEEAEEEEFVAASDGLNANENDRGKTFDYDVQDLIGE